MTFGTKIITDKTDIAEHFNNFFTNIGPDLASKVHTSKTELSSYLKTPTINSLFLFPANAAEIKTIVKQLKNKKMRRI